MNLPSGSEESGERGILSDPTRVPEYNDSLPVALELAREVGCTRMNALVGVRTVDVAEAEQLEMAVERVRWTAAALRKQDSTLLIEALNRFDAPGYLLPTTLAAAEFVRTVASPNVRVQYDLYHSTRSGERWQSVLPLYLPLIGHVQIADVPGRGAPGSGDVDFRGFFSTLATSGYADYVGLEYSASHLTKSAFEWCGACGVQIG
jgi:hydroxypyruvate isomerase